jgi:hypothetical protein
MRKIKLQYLVSIILIFIGIIITIFLLNSLWLLLGLMFIGGGIIIFFSYLEQKWVKKKYLKWGLLATIIFAIVYGILEYILFDSTWNNWFKISDWFPNKYYYWAFMAILNFSITILVSRGSLSLSLSSIPLFAVNEDLWYWITKSIHELEYVFPVKNWFDQKFSFLQGLGEPIPFLPYWPRFYFVGWLLISILIVIRFKEFKDKKFLYSTIIFIGSCFLCLFLVPIFI